MQMQRDTLYSIDSWMRRRPNVCPWRWMLTDLPYVSLIRLVFTRAAIDAGLRIEAVLMTEEHVRLVLRCHGLLELEGLQAALRMWMDRNAAVADTMNGKYVAGFMKELNRPGAWLLDYVATVLYAAKYTLKPRAKYKVVLNSELVALVKDLNLVSSNGARVGLGMNSNNLGNLIEYLAWLALEDDRCALIVALAWHSQDKRGNVGDSGLRAQCSTTCASVFAQC